MRAPGRSILLAMAGLLLLAGTAQAQAWEEVRECVQSQVPVKSELVPQMTLGPGDQQPAPTLDPQLDPRCALEASSRQLVQLEDTLASSGDSLPGLPTVGPTLDVPVGPLAIIDVPSDGSSRRLTLPARSSYDIEASGTYQYSTNPGAYARADAACNSWTGSEWTSSAPQNNVLSLLVNGAFAWTGLPCDPQEHTYTVAATCPGENPCSVEFRILDTWYGDNSGSLTVKLTSTGTQTGIGAHGVPSHEADRLGEDLLPGPPPSDESGDDSTVPETPGPSVAPTRDPSPEPRLSSVDPLPPIAQLLLPPDPKTAPPPQACPSTPDALRAAHIEADAAQECGEPTRAAPPASPAAAAPSLPAPAVWSSVVWGGLAALGVSFMLWPLLDPLYSRLRPAQVLANPQRGRLLNLVRSRGSLPLPQLVEALGGSRTATRYHLAVLARAGHLRIQKAAGVTMVCLPGAAPAPPPMRASPSLARLLSELRTRPGRDQVALAQDLSVSRQRVAFLLSRLASEGAVEARLEGSRRTYWPKHA